MKLHQLTYEIYGTFPAHRYIPIKPVWSKVARAYAADRAVAQRVLHELEILGKTGWLSLTKLHQAGGAVLGYKRPMTAWQLRTAISQLPDTGWLPHGAAGSDVANAYHQRLAAKYPTVKLVGGAWVTQGEAVGSAGRAAA